ncbi:MAG: mannose-1-phosphate guanylyltransferase [Balneolales bacterium]|nr:mannose-1-phosphate guanylyltransferase [Balneolales bacterium]
MRYAVIMAGGSGTRFWPKSTSSKPKQFLKLIGDRTMLRTTVDRISKMIPFERILVITNASYTGLVASQVPEIPSENIIGEPMGKNTAPVVAAAAAITAARDSQASMIVLPSDHYIRDEETYLKIVNDAFLKAESGEHLVTIGIRPHRPETGFGYIQMMSDQQETVGSNKVVKVKTFAEKPVLETAIQFLESGDFLWNSGMFIWQSRVIMDAFRKFLPDMYHLAERLAKNYDTSREASINSFYEAVESVSIDYGIMEKAATVYVVPAEFGWSDVGSWLAIYELDPKDDDGNVIHAENSAVEDSQNCYVSLSSGKMIALVGLHGVGVVETDKVIMVCKMDRCQDVKHITGRLTKENELLDFK